MPDSRQLKQRYTQTGPRPRAPYGIGRSELELSRLGVFWRPLIDMSDCDHAPLRLRMIGPVSELLAEPESGQWSWFSRIGLAGLRHQVIGHAGLGQYACTEPAGLPEALRTPRWERLVDAVQGFAGLDHRRRALVVFQLAQLSYQRLAVRLSGPVEPGGSADQDRYVYEVARVLAACPGGAPQALRLFEDLCRTAGHPLTALSACFQGIGHTLRNGPERGPALQQARSFAARGRELLDQDSSWHGCLVRSRFLRAAALLALAEGDLVGAQRELRAALSCHAELAADPASPVDALVVAENRRYLLELELSVTARLGERAAPGTVGSLCELLITLDPSCVQARLAVGDAFAAAQDHATAAHWYTRAGELGSGAGALGWFRAAQCFDRLGDRGSALNAMGHLLELDPTAAEAREYLAAAL